MSWIFGLSEESVSIINVLFISHPIYKILFYKIQNPTFVRSGWYWEFQGWDDEKSLNELLRGRFNYINSNPF